MKSLLTFATAIADPARLRLLALIQDQKLSAEEVAVVLNSPLPDLAKQVKTLVTAGLLKQVEDGQPLKLKRNYSSLLESLFARFSLSTKKDATLKKDASQAKELRKAKRAAKKLMDKISGKKASPAKSKPKTDPKIKAKTKTKTKPKAKVKTKTKAEKKA